MTAETTFSVTARAARQIAKIIANEGAPKGAAAKSLRLSVSGGGCAGFSYHFDLDDKIAADDLVIAQDGITVVVDAASLPFVAGAELDYVDEMIGAAFKVNNPNAKSSCGCGTSFSV